MPSVGSTCHALLLLAGKRIDTENFDTEDCNLYVCFLIYPILKKRKYIIYLIPFLVSTRY